MYPEWVLDAYKSTFFWCRLHDFRAEKGCFQEKHKRIAMPHLHSSKEHVRVNRGCLAGSFSSSVGTPRRLNVAIL